MSTLDDLAAQLRAAGCVYAQDEAQLLLAAEPDTERDARIARRLAGEPLEHVLGWAAFRGHRLAVGPGVFIPRRRSEFLADQALALGRPREVVLDLCCGVAPLAVVLGSALRPRALLAADIDPLALRCARDNLAPLGGEVHLGDLFDALPAALRGGIDLLVANAPYVATDALPMLPREARLHEPRRALDGGPDGQALQRRIAAGAREWLAPGGRLLIETSAAQAARLADFMQARGLAARIARAPDMDATVVIGTAG